MMNLKRTIGLILFALMIIVVAGCRAEDNTDSRAVNDTSQVQAVLDKVTSEEKSQPEVVEEEKTEKETKQASQDADGVDIDLTVLSSTMVYSEVYDMMYHPGKYMGKTVKMKGTYFQVHDDSTGKDYFGCIIKDATACCAQGIEFELTDEYVFPDDYPEEGAEICVTGTFDTYKEGETTYCTLRNAGIS